jgi:hypothetical protein
MPDSDRRSDGDEPQHHRYRSAALKERSVLVLTSVTFAGIALVGIGWVMAGSSYVPGLFMQLGTSMMLLVPLALLGLMLENRLRQTEQQLHSTDAKLERLTAVTREGLAASRRQRDDLFDSARQAPQQDTVSALFENAEEIGAIDPRGVRVLVPGTELRLRFRHEGDAIRVQVEERDGAVRGHFTWDKGDSPRAFSHGLILQLNELKTFPGDPDFDPAAVLRQLLETIQLGVRSRTGEHSEDFGHLIEIPNEHWVISAEGLYSRKRHYHIPAQSITSSHDDWPRHMQSIGWVDTTAFNDAFQLARHLLGARQAS